ncbi:MAG: NUDIX domain-containing protein [Spirochaetes bacterium]|nr:NUDIX domain-containing protein [Spirochaetota bacterium]
MRVRVAGVLVHDNRLLLVQHEKDSKTYWLLPGGGVGLGERLQDSLVREFTEELNQQVTVMDLLLVVETVSPQGEHILQPTFLVTAENIDDIHLGSDKRVVDYSFFRQDKINEITLYPDIKEELLVFLQSSRIDQRYVLKSWID